MPVKITDTIHDAAKVDIEELHDKINKFRLGIISEERFRSFRLTRGVYGQRQQGVQMIRIKLPYGRLTVNQWNKICDVSDKFSTGVLHLTTRQDIQIHYVKLEDTPQVWNDLEEAQVTLREACGNTVRNVTASVTAGVDPQEPFDVTPYAHAFYQYFLRNPICQDMGRKFKVSFSSSDHDTALSYIHDLGFLPKIKDGKRGFKVMVGGGLGAQPFLAQVAHDFLPEEQMIPFSEAVLRVFDRYGERTRRHKARMKYLLSDIGLEEFMKLVALETPALKSKEFVIDTASYPQGDDYSLVQSPIESPVDIEKYNRWRSSNVYAQKQEGAYGVFIRVRIGNIPTDVARKFSALVSQIAADDIRVTINQGLFIKFVSESSLPFVFNRLEELGFAEPGHDSTADITTCPGTDTCNLGIASSYGITHVLEDMMKNEYKDLIHNHDIKIKISGCMNSCAQHGMASIGLHGSSIKVGELVMPAMQLLLGGGVLGNGEGAVGDKVIKLPTKRIPAALRTLFEDYEAHASEGEYFRPYYLRRGKNYFYQLLKPLAEVKNPEQDMFVDWGHEELFTTEVGVGECASVIIDLVATLLQETEDKLVKAQETFDMGLYADSIYHAYSVYISTAKALLTGKEVHCSTQHQVISEFDTHFTSQGLYASFVPDFKSTVLQINKVEPNASFAKSYLEGATAFLKAALDESRQIAVNHLANQLLEKTEG